MLAQHGGNMGTGYLSQPEHHQVLIADKFCTWGWTSDVDQSTIPMPSLSLSSINLSYNPNGSLLLILASYPRYFYCQYSVPVASQFLYYLNYQISFLNSLKLPILESLNIRLNCDSYGWNIKQRLADHGFLNI